MDDPEHRGSTATLARPGRGGPKVPVGAVLRVLNAPAQPPTFRLALGRCVVGSGSACDLVIQEPTVSRAHAEVELVAEGVSVRDLGSRNGIFYLGQRVERMTLTLGSQLQLGGALVAFEPDTEALGERLAYGDEAYRGVIGRSAAMQRLFAVLSRLEGSLTPVLLEGESGAGKEVIARAIHEGSPAGRGPLVAVNCGALPRELIASELFGHKKGAFTGASEARAGAFEAASGGTLFLDEVGELPLELQPVLLRALELGEVRPVGSDQVKHVKVRLLSATNLDLEEQVRLGKFRRDLYFRLAVIKLTVPPLRDRPEDVELLAQHFARQAGLPPLPASAVEQLKARPLPGNARELKNAVLAYAVLGALPEASRPPLSVLDLALSEAVDLGRPYVEQKDELLERFNRLYLRALLAQAGGNLTAAARISGLDRGYLRRLLGKHDVGRGEG